MAHVFEFTEQVFFQPEPSVHRTGQLSAQVPRVLVPRSVGREGWTSAPAEPEVGGREGLGAEVERRRARVPGAPQDPPRDLRRCQTQVGLRTEFWGRVILHDLRRLAIVNV